MVEDQWIDVRARVLRHVDLDLVDMGGSGDRDDLSETRLELDDLRPHVDRVRIEPRKVEKLLDQRGHAMRLLFERFAQLEPSALPRAATPTWLSVCTKPWIVVTGVRSSCAASATKFVISSFARSSASRVSCSCSKSRTRSSAVAVRPTIVCSVRSSSWPKNGAYGDVHATNIRPSSSITTPPSRLHGSPGRELVALCVTDREAAGADERSGRFGDACCDLRAGHGEPDEPAHRLLQTRLLGCAPVRAHDSRRIDAEVEARDRDEPDQLNDERARLGLVGGERRAEQGDRERRGREREDAHALRGDRRLPPAGPQQPHGDRHGQKHPVHEEGDHVEREPQRPRLARRRDVRERERENRQAGRERYDDAAKKEPGRRELRREPVEQVREEHEQLDVAPLLEVLEHAVRVRRCKAADGDE